MAESFTPKQRDSLARLIERYWNCHIQTRTTADGIPVIYFQKTLNGPMLQFEIYPDGRVNSIG